MEGRKEESLSLLYPSAFTAPGAVLDLAVGRPPVYQIWYKERKLTQCYSFLLPFPLRLSASCSLSLSPAVVCSQHVANRVNDVDACRKSHSESVGIASGRRVSRTMTDFFLVSRPESVASPFLPKHHGGYRVSTLVAIPGAGAPSLYKDVRSFT